MSPSHVQGQPPLGSEFVPCRRCRHVEKLHECLAASSGLPLACNLVRRTLTVAWKPRSTLSQWPGGNGPSRLPRRASWCRLADPTIWTTSPRPEKPITQPTPKPAKVSCQQSLRIRQGGAPEASAGWRAAIPISPITGCSNWTRKLTLTVRPVVVQMVRHLSRPGLPAAGPRILSQALWMD